MPRPRRGQAWAECHQKIKEASVEVDIIKHVHDIALFEDSMGERAFSGPRLHLSEASPGVYHDIALSEGSCPPGKPGLDARSRAKALEEG